MFPPLYRDFFDLQPKKRECTPEIFPASTQKYGPPRTDWTLISGASMDLLAQYSDSEGEVGSMGFQRAPMTDSHGKNGNFLPTILLLDFYGKCRWIYHICGACGLGKIEESRSFWKWLRLSNEWSLTKIADCWIPRCVSLFSMIVQALPVTDDDF